MMDNCDMHLADCLVQKIKFNIPDNRSHVNYR